MTHQFLVQLFFEQTWLGAIYINWILAIFCETPGNSFMQQYAQVRDGGI